MLRSVALASSAAILSPSGLATASGTPYVESTAAIAGPLDAASATSVFCSQGGTTISGCFSSKRKIPIRSAPASSE